MTVELGGFWRKPTDVEEFFLRRRGEDRGIGRSEGARKEWRDSLVSVRGVR
jgi:hypothetical protein